MSLVPLGKSFSKGSLSLHQIIRNCSSKGSKYANLSKGLSEESKAVIERIIRVDHAGELGADRIYAGQMAVLGKKFENNFY